MIWFDLSVYIFITVTKQNAEIDSIDIKGFFLTYQGNLTGEK
jgi:hypothetical protein